MKNPHTHRRHGFHMHCRECTRMFLYVYVEGILRADDGYCKFMVSGSDTMECGARAVLGAICKFE